MNSTDILILILLGVIFVIAIILLWDGITNVHSASKWEKIQQDMQQCNKLKDDEYVTCVKTIFYKYDEADEYEKIKKKCFDSYKDMCTLSTKIEKILNSNNIKFIDKNTGKEIKNISFDYDDYKYLVS